MYLEVETWLSSFTLRNQLTLHFLQLFEVGLHRLHRFLGWRIHWSAPNKAQNESPGGRCFGQGDLRGLLGW